MVDGSADAASSAAMGFVPLPEDTRERITLPGAGQTVLNVPFYFERNEDIEIAVLVLGGWTDLAGDQYTLTGKGNPSGGTATLVTSANGATQYRVRGMAPIDRIASVVVAGRYNSGQLDGEITRNRVIQQEIRRDLDKVDIDAIIAAGQVAIAAAASAAQSAAEALAAAQAALAASGGLVFADRPAGVATTIPAGAEFCRLSGYYEPGDGGGGLYRKAATMPPHLARWQSADGAWWELIPEPAGCSVKQVGARSNLITNDAGVVTDWGTDNLFFFAATHEFCHLGGFNMLIPPGKYRLSNKWTIDCSTDPDGVLWARYRYTIKGAGKRATYLFFDPGDFDGILYKGTSGGGNPTLEHVSQPLIQGMTLIKPDRLGIGLTCQDHFHAAIDDVICTQWNYGLQFLDVHETTLRDVLSMFNNQGGYIARGDDTQPNVISMWNCTFNSNVNHGLDIISPSQLTMTGGSIDYNGINGTDNTKRWGMRIQVGPSQLQGVALATLVGVRFESNVSPTKADFYYVNGLDDGAINMVGVDFLRDGGFGVPADQKWCKHNILLEVGGGKQHRLNLDGCGFKGFNSYVPDASRPAIELLDKTQDVIVSDKNSLFAHSVEEPNFGQWGRNQTRQFLNSGWNATTDAVGTIVPGTGANVSFIGKTATGRYDVTFRRPQRQSFYHVSFTPFLSAIREWSILAMDANGFTVQFWDNTGAAADTQFSFSVTGGA